MEAAKSSEAIQMAFRANMHLDNGNQMMLISNSSSNLTSDAMEAIMASEGDHD